MSRKSVAKVAAMGLAIGAVFAMGVAGPASAAPVKFPVDVVVHTDFSGAPSEFEGNIPGCETGTVEDVSGGPRFTQWGGVYVGEKEFTCDGGVGGFTVSMKARFGEAGATGTWNIIDAWGWYEGVKASGSLTGTPSDIGIDDRYTGSAH